MAERQLDRKLIDEAVKKLGAAGSIFSACVDAVAIRAAVMNAHARNPRKNADEIAGMVRDMYKAVDGKGESITDMDKQMDEIFKDKTPKGRRVTHRGRTV